jgi:NAD(P)-dependent dehydrogenase (short-subunit alcohol dehydrogenase family)
MSARDRTSLDGRVALITGSGSSEGIGFAAARIGRARGLRRHRVNTIQELRGV